MGVGDALILAKLLVVALNLLAVAVAAKVVVSAMVIRLEAEV